MYNILELINKPVLAVYEGEIIGEIKNLIFDDKIKKLHYLQIDNKEDDSTLYVSPNAIYNVGKNAVTIKNKSSLIDSLPDGKYLKDLFGLRAYTIEGEFVGKLHDIELVNLHGMVKNFIFADSTLPQNRLASASQNSLVFLGENSKEKLTRFKNKKSPLPQKEVEEIIAEPVVNPEIVLKANVVNTQNLNRGISFMIGKICTKDILGINEETIIKKGSRINTTLVQTATRYGKLKELMIYCE